MNILLADDHPFTLAGIKHLLEGHGHRIVDACTNGIVALNSIQTKTPDLAILDINMPGMDGLDIAQKAKEKRLPVKIVLLTMHREMSLYLRAKQYGVSGYLLKDYAEEELLKCLEALEKGGGYVSPRLDDDLKPDIQQEGLDGLTLAERKVVQLIAQHKTSRQIGEILFISEKTVEGHRSKIIEKLGLPKEKNALLRWAAGLR
jgi:DNA-binding NarL/FixJ family response regulator